MATVSIHGLDKAAVLAALYNASSPRGMGFMHFDPEPMTTEQAQKYFDDGYSYFDYLNGRVMKVEFNGDEFDTRLYDRDHGDGACERIISELRDSGSVNPATSQAQSRADTLANADHVMQHLGDEQVSRVTGNLHITTLGYANIADKLRPAVERALDYDVPKT